MKKRGLKSIPWTVIFGVVLLLAVCFGLWKWFDKMNGHRHKETDYALFSWEPEVLEEKEWGSLIKCMDQADVSVLYQEFSKQSLAEAGAAPFVKRMYDEGVDVYALVGKAEWAYEQDGAHIIKWLRRVATYNVNRGMEERIVGIMIDIEPYLLDEWDEGGEARDDLMWGYLESVKLGFKYAREHGLRYMICIPTFYDKYDDDFLEELITEGCDAVAVMNYDRRDEYGQIEDEVELARACDKEIVCIFELQEAGSHSLEEINTYAGEGLEALWNAVDVLSADFGYDKLKFAYHYYKPLKQMLKQLEQ